MTLDELLEKIGIETSSRKLFKRKRRNRKIKTGIRNTLWAGGTAAGVGTIALAARHPKLLKKLFDISRKGAAKNSDELADIVRKEITTKNLKLPKFKISKWQLIGSTDPSSWHTPGRIDNLENLNIPVYAEKHISSAKPNPRFVSTPLPFSKDINFNRIHLDGELNPKILLHELGHAQDIIYNNKTYSYKDMIKDYIRAIAGPKRTKQYKLEEIAWNNAGVDANDPIRIAALDTYINQGRVNQLSGISAVGLVGGNVMDKHLKEEK
jgi:hypothetical protein